MSKNSILLYFYKDKKIEKLKFVLQFCKKKLDFASLLRN